MLELARVYLIVFGLVTIAGGVLGFVKAKSQASLIAGGISGIALAIAGYLIGTPQPRIGFILGFVVSLLLTARFGNAFRKTKKVMPALLITVLGVGAIILCALGLRAT